MHKRLANLLLLLLASMACCRAFAAELAAAGPHVIQIVDAQSGRGVPLVELKTVNNVSFLTDSAGLAAIDDRSMLDRKIFFYVSSAGYEFPADGFGFHGVAIQLSPGKQTTLKLKRLNIAERLYRITGQGIYRDSVLAGRDVPIRQPLLNAQVAGQDSAQAVIFGGKIYWFYGDTLRTSYPLGHFWTAGATSSLPGSGGLDPAVGIDLNYFTDDNGFSRGMFAREDNHPIWLDGVIVIRDPSGEEKLIGRASRMKSLETCLGRSLVMFNPQTAAFEKVIDIPLDVPLSLRGHPFVATDSGKSYIYSGDCFPDVRVRADWASVCDTSRYEGFTCLKSGSRFDKAHPQIDRDAAGRLVWGWKADTSVFDSRELHELIESRLIKQEELYFRPLDVTTQKPVWLVGGSVNFNAFRKRWIMIGAQLGGGASMLGEIWYSEADRPEGPWRWARKIVTHDHYSFYNPVQHSFFDQNGGRLVYFEGTYSNSFSGNEHPTPFYDYNQIMYRLDLADPRLALPAASP